MMGFGSGIGWILVPVLWVVLVVVIVWALVTLLRTEGGNRGQAESPSAVLDRRLAGGEIDLDEYARLRSHLAASGAEPPRSPSPARTVGLVVVVVTALLALLGTIIWSAFTPWGPGGMMNRSWSVSDVWRADCWDTSGGPMTGGPTRDGHGVGDGGYGVAGTGPVTGMLSVNASTGAVRYHAWHGEFVAMDDDGGT